jgi:hypothetical protein
VFHVSSCDVNAAAAPYTFDTLATRLTWAAGSTSFASTEVKPPFSVGYGVRHVLRDDRVVIGIRGSYVRVEKASLA